MHVKYIIKALARKVEVGMKSIISKKHQGLEIFIQALCVCFCTTPVAHRTEYILHKEGHE